MNHADENFEKAKDAWNQSWLFYKKYHLMPESEEMWDAAIEDMYNICKNGDNLVKKKLMIRALSLLEDEKS